MRSHLRLTWKQATATAVSKLALLSASEQTRLTWARRIDSYANVPEAFKSFYAPLLAAGQKFPYTILTPSAEGFLFLQTTEKLISDLGDEIVVLERSGETYEAVCFPLDGISYLEIRSVLLDSRIKITGVTSQGTPASKTLRYNAVTDFLFTPILRKIRCGSRTADYMVAEPGKVSTGSPGERFDEWTGVNFKLRNFARQSLLGSENVQHAILQREIRTSRFTVLGKTFYKTIAPALACILTDRELIFIRDDLRQIQVGSTRYGGIWDYIPLTKVMDLSIEEGDSRLRTFSVLLADDSRLEFQFEASKEAELTQLVGRVQS